MVGHEVESVWEYSRSICWLTCRPLEVILDVNYYTAEISSSLRLYLFKSVGLAVVLSALGLVSVAWFCCLSVTGITLQLEPQRTEELVLWGSSEQMCTKSSAICKCQPVFSLQTGSFCVFTTVLTAAFFFFFLKFLSASGHKLLLVFTACSWLFPPCHLCWCPGTRADQPGPSCLWAAPCMLLTVVQSSPNRLASKLESSVLQMALSLIRKSLMSAKSHMGARVCSSVMKVCSSVALLVLGCSVLNSDFSRVWITVSVSRCSTVNSSKKIIIKKRINRNLLFIYFCQWNSRKRFSIHFLIFIPPMTSCMSRLFLFAWSVCKC